MAYINEKLKLMKEITKTIRKFKHKKGYTMLSSKGDFFLDMQVDVQNSTVLSAEGSSI